MDLLDPKELSRCLDRYPMLELRELNEIGYEERVVRVLRKLRKSEADLFAEKKSAAWKVEIARVLCALKRTRRTHGSPADSTWETPAT